MEYVWQHAWDGVCLGQLIVNPQLAYNIAAVTPFARANMARSLHLRVQTWRGHSIGDYSGGRGRIQMRRRTVNCAVVIQNFYGKHCYCYYLVQNQIVDKSSMVSLPLR